MPGPGDPFSLANSVPHPTGRAVHQKTKGRGRGAAGPRRPGDSAQRACLPSVILTARREAGTPQGAGLLCWPGKGSPRRHWGVSGPTEPNARTGQCAAPTLAGSCSARGSPWGAVDPGVRGVEVQREGAPNAGSRPRFPRDDAFLGQRGLLVGGGRKDSGRPVLAQLGPCPLCGSTAPGGFSEGNADSGLFLCGFFPSPQPRTALALPGREHRPEPGRTQAPVGPLQLMWPRLRKGAWSWLLLRPSSVPCPLARVCPGHRPQGWSCSDSPLPPTPGAGSQLQRSQELLPSFSLLSPQGSQRPLWLQGSSSAGP